MCVYIYIYMCGVLAQVHACNNNTHTLTDTQDCRWTVRQHLVETVTPPGGDCHATWWRQSRHLVETVTPPGGDSHATWWRQSRHLVETVTPPGGDSHATWWRLSRHLVDFVTPPGGRSNATWWRVFSPCSQCCPCSNNVSQCPVNHRCESQQ